jgi:small subunit ribosomal protein S17
MKIFTGEVVKTREKTAVVAVTRVVVHPLYKKRLKKIRKYQVHDEIGVKVGDKVNFVGTRPYSKLKRWKIVK